MTNKTTAEETEFERGYSSGQRDCKEYFESRLNAIADEVEGLTPKEYSVKNGTVLVAEGAVDLQEVLKIIQKHI